MRIVCWITLAGLMGGTVLAGSGTNSLLQSPSSSSSVLSRSPSAPSRAVAPDRPEWRDPRSLLDESRPPSSANPQARAAWQRRDLPQLDQTVREMERSGRPEHVQEFLDDLDWYFARQERVRPEPLPKPPGPPEGLPRIGDVTPFDLESAPSTQPAQPTTREGE